MSRGARRRRRPRRRGTNSEGHVYTRYSDGAFCYRNVDAATGRTASTYFNDGSGHAFYRDLDRGYGFHQVLSTGERRYFGEDNRDEANKKKKRSRRRRKSE